MGCRWVVQMCWTVDVWAAVSRAVVGCAVVVTVLLYALLASWTLQSLRVGFLKPLLVGDKRRKLVLAQRVGALTLSWC